MTSNDNILYVAWIPFAGRHYQTVSIFKNLFVFYRHRKQSLRNCKNSLPSPAGKSSEPLTSWIKWIILKWARPPLLVNIFKPVIVFHRGLTPSQQKPFYHKWLKDCPFGFWFQTCASIFEQQYYTESPPHIKPGLIKWFHYLKSSVFIHSSTSAQTSNNKHCLHQTFQSLIPKSAQVCQRKPRNPCPSHGRTPP